MNPLAFVRRLVRRLGFDVVRYDPRTHPFARMMRLLAHHSIDVVFDVGANAGQYARGLRTLGYTGRIVSFEPITAAYTVLARHAARDAAWTAVQAALGEAPGTAQIHVAGNLQSSSLLEMLPAHVAHTPASAYVREETITVSTLSTAVHDHTRAGDRLLVKADTQGYEQQVVRGGLDVLDRIAGFQLELSLVPLYDGAPLAPEMIRFMDELGFTLMGIEPAYSDTATGQLLQIDGLFFRP